MEAKEFAAFASRLSQAQGSGPAAFRTAISRAYYAAFNVAVHVLKQIGSPAFEGPGAHQEVACSLMACKDEALRIAGTSMDQLRTRRIQADYRMERIDVEKKTTAVQVCETAHEVIRELEKLLVDEERQALVKLEIEAHQRVIRGESKA